MDTLSAIFIKSSVFAFLYAIAVSFDYSYNVLKKILSPVIPLNICNTMLDFA